MDVDVNRLAKLLNLERGDKIRNESDTNAEVYLKGFGNVLIPVHGEIILTRKGVTIKGNWSCSVDVVDGRVTLVLERFIPEEVDASKPLLS